MLFVNRMKNNKLYNLLFGRFKLCIINFVNHLNLELFILLTALTVNIINKSICIFEIKHENIKNKI